MAASALRAPASGEPVASTTKYEVDAQRADRLDIGRHHELAARECLPRLGEVAAGRDALDGNPRAARRAHRPRGIGVHRRGDAQPGDAGRAVDEGGAELADADHRGDEAARTRQQGRVIHAGHYSSRARAPYRMGGP